MFEELNLTCPACHKAFPLTDNLAQSLVGAAVKHRLAEEREFLTKHAEQKAANTLGMRLTQAEELLAATQLKLSESQAKELAILIEQKRLTQEKRELELQIERR